MNRAYRNRMHGGLAGIVLVGLVASGCASMGIRTEGEIQGMRWHTLDYRHYVLVVEERDVYDYTLVLDETEGRDVTFTKLKARIRNSPHSREFKWEKTGRWHLPARGTLAIDLGSWRYCLEVNCQDWGPFAPVWHLILVGTDTQGQPIHKIIQIRLPYTDETASSETLTIPEPQPPNPTVLLDDPILQQQMGTSQTLLDSSTEEMIQDLRAIQVTADIWLYGFGRGMPSLRRSCTRVSTSSRWRVDRQPSVSRLCGGNDRPGDQGLERLGLAGGDTAIDDQHPGRPSV